MTKEPQFSLCMTITNEQNNFGCQQKSWQKCKNVKGHTVLMTGFYHMIPDRTKSLLTKVHKGVFKNEIDSFSTSEVTQVSMAIKYGIQVISYKRKWGIILR